MDRQTDGMSLKCNKTISCHTFKMLLGEYLIMPWGHNNEIYDKTYQMEKILEEGR